MPGRVVPLISQEVYHVFNRGIDRQPTFTTRRELTRAADTLKFYRFNNPHVRLSQFLRFDNERQEMALRIISNKGQLVNIYAYCLMPNLFYFFLQSLVDGGISKLLSNFQNSYTRYFNTRHRRDGALFLDQFKAVRIETDEQLIHVNRYIHLNPYTSYVVKTLKDLEEYEWSSLSEYNKESKDFVKLDPILKFFRNVEKYRKFVFDQADYQRTLKSIEHLTFE